MARTRKDSATRRADIVAAARALFFERGVDGTSIEDIARAAGVAHGTFYLYFTTKDAAVNAVMEEIAREAVERVARTAASDDVPAAEKVVAVGEMLAGLSASAARDSGDLIAHYHGPEHRAVHDRLAREVSRQLVPVLTGIIAQGVSEGVFDVPDPEAAAALIVSAAEGLDLVRSDDAEAVSRHVEALMTFALRGLGA